MKRIKIHQNIQFEELKNSIFLSNFSEDHLKYLIKKSTEFLLDYILNLNLNLETNIHNPKWLVGLIRLNWIMQLTKCPSIFRPVLCSGSLRLPSFSLLWRGGGPFGPCWRPSAPIRVAISKLWTLNFEKLKICVTLIAILYYLEAKLDYGYFIIFFCYGFIILHKKFQVISCKNEGVTLIFLFLNEIKIRKNRRHAFIFARNHLKFFV